MRVLFINTTDVSGGAAIIACRLMRGLKQYYDTENFFLVRYRKGSMPSTEVTISSFFQKAVERSMDKLTKAIGLQYLFYPFSSAKILDCARQLKPDIISLHNIHGGYFATPLLVKLSKIAPVVWTLHDMWSFTGNAAHTFGNTSWKEMRNDAHLTKIYPSIGINTGVSLLKLKKRNYNQSNITLVTPSVWLKELAEQSPVFEGKRIVQIYNGVDTSTFAKKDKKACRLGLGLPTEGKTIMFSAETISLNNTWKGGGMLLEILKRIDSLTKEKINLLVLGSGEMKEIYSFNNFTVFHKGYVNVEDIMSDYLNAADVFIYPSKADNLPNILVESIACGTPCITFDIGGNSEIIEDDYNGYVIAPFNFDDFAEKTIGLLNDKNKSLTFSSNCIDMTKKRFLLEDMTDQYFQLFSTVKLNS
jgi:glycosyltransferase involved in cell wall biosynthesis